MNRKLGLKLISIGARIAFKSDADRDELKGLINSDTVLGSHADSGGHIHGKMTPMNNYDTQSVINILKNIEQCVDQKNGPPPSKMITHYKEEWVN